MLGTEPLAQELLARLQDGDYDVFYVLHGETAESYHVYGHQKSKHRRAIDVGVGGHNFSPIFIEDAVELADKNQAARRQPKQKIMTKTTTRRKATKPPASVKPKVKKTPQRQNVKTKTPEQTPPTLAQKPEQPESQIPKLLTVRGELGVKSEWGYLSYPEAKPEPTEILHPWLATPASETDAGGAPKKADENAAPQERPVRFPPELAQPYGRKAEVAPCNAFPMLRIRARIDIGLGNHLTAYGNWESEGGWEKGQPMVCILPDLWELLVPVSNAAAKTIDFKVKLNDTTWETGMNHPGLRNSQVEFTPKFE